MSEYSDYDSYERDCEKRAKMHPRCHICDGEIYEEKAMCFDGRWCCLNDGCEYEFLHSYVRDALMEEVEQ